MITTTIESTQTQSIAIVGNPNSGKSSLFNRLTGMRQKTGNYPGVTVDKKTGRFNISDKRFKVTDLPGSYSIFPNTMDEKITTRIILETLEDDDESPCYIYVADVTRLEKQILLFTQLLSLQLPVILCLNMADRMDGMHARRIENIFRKKFSVPVVALSAKTGEGIDRLKQILSEYNLEDFRPEPDPFFDPGDQFLFTDTRADERTNFGGPVKYADFVKRILSEDGYPFRDRMLSSNEAIAKSQRIQEQIRDTMHRYAILDPFIQHITSETQPTASKTDSLDHILTHKIWGPTIFIGLMLLIFQAIFAWSQYPMEWIETGFGQLSHFIDRHLPSGWITDLLTEGILAGIGGVVIFIPQIAILFFLIGILEQTGYMTRVVFMMDSSLRRFGMNGRSVVALVSGGACAIPAIMSTRNIAGWKERLITIMVTPLISCSARIPVYAILIAMVVPYKTIGGIFNLQGLAFGLMYFLGGFMALVVGWVMKKIIKTGTDSFLMLEMPDYTWPDWKTILITVYHKVKTFVTEAGKIIFIISIILWFMASYGPPERMAKANLEAETQAMERGLNGEETAVLASTYRIENSYAGIMGQAIEPIIRPIGFDWKIGIALITSFAAREVFVGTMATIYSIDSEDNTSGLRERMSQATYADTGKKVYTPATIWSLLVFYAFAMQCMSTLAVVRKETNSWKWPFIQFVYLTLLAYFSSFIIYHILS